MEGSNMTTLLLPVQSLPNSSREEALHSLWLPNASPPFYGSGVADLTEAQGDDIGDNGNYEGSCLRQPEKKRRLSVDQVKFLERSFEVENKLEPDRKVQLAKEIGLQPRQVAIWFQNRRARCKTKLLEREYNCLKSSYDKLRSDYDTMFKENDKLKNEVHFLKEKLFAREKCEAKLDHHDSTSSPNDEIEKQITREVSKFKQEVANSGESEVFDSENAHFTGRNNSSSMQEPDGHSHDFEAENSDEDDSLSRRLLQPPCFPKLEDVCCNDLSRISCTMEHDQNTWFWPY